MIFVIPHILFADHTETTHDIALLALAAEVAVPHEEDVVQILIVIPLPTEELTLAIPIPAIEAPIHIRRREAMMTMNAVTVRKQSPQSTTHVMAITTATPTHNDRLQL